MSSIKNLFTSRFSEVGNDLLNGESQKKGYLNISYTKPKGKRKKLLSDNSAIFFSDIQQFHNLERESFEITKMGLFSDFEALIKDMNNIENNAKYGDADIKAIHQELQNTYNDLDNLINS